MASILVIDDVPAVLLSIRIVLQGSGHTVTGVQDGGRALELLKGTKFDLVITDIWMPGSSGTDVIREGRKRSPKTRFLAITGGNPNVSGPQDPLRREDYGADAVLLKPFEKAELLSAVSLVLEASAP
jgi:CheY-like chemotaxis protein